MVKVFRYLVVFVFLMSAGGAVLAQGVVGEAIPHDLQAVDQHNEPQNFESLRGARGAVLVFVRSADWCPFCQTQLIELGERGQEIEGLGYNLVVISYDGVETLSAFTKKYDFSYPMLSDPASDIIKAFGILNEEHKPGSFAYGIPHPGIYIVGIDQVIKARLFKEGYKERPTIDQVVQVIQDLRRP